MNPTLLTATSLHRCDICAERIHIGEKYYEHYERIAIRTRILRECASCAEAAGRWTS